MNAAPAASSPVPAAAAWLTGLGMLPFAGLAVAYLAMPGRAGEAAAFGVLVYGAVILSFLGGIRWGLAIAPGRPPEGGRLWNALMLSISPALAAWLAMLTPPPWPPLVLAAAFLLMLAVDRQAANKGDAPSWYARLRWPPTVAAVLSLMVVGLA